MALPHTDSAASELPSRRLRVASVYRSFNTLGSIEALYLRNVERLAQDEDVTVFTSATARAQTEASLTFVPVEPVVRGRGRLRYALECSTFARRASRAVGRRRAEFDVVHVEGFAAYDADLVTVHAVRAAEIEHYFTHVDADVVRHWLGPLVRPQAGVVMRTERRLFQRSFAPYCICPSNGVKRDLERVHGVPSDRIKVLPYGVDLDRFRRDPVAAAHLRAELGTPPDRLVLLFVGSDFERKGLDAAIAGLAQSRAPDAELWVIGGSDAERERIERATRGLAGRVRLLGMQAPADLPAFYSAADIFVLPTRQDSWAIPVTEALASGCVAVTSEYAGSCDLITHGVDGYVLQGGGSGEELAALLDGPLADPGIRTTVAARGRETIAPYDYESFYAEYRAAHRFAYELARERLAAGWHAPRLAAATSAAATVTAARQQGRDR